MTLNSFTMNDRRRLQFYLNLPIDAVREGSSLYQALVYVEQLDADTGLSIASDVKGRLTLLDTFDSVNGQVSALGDAMQSIESQAKRVDIFQSYEVEFHSASGQAKSIRSWMDRLISDIRRDIGFSRNPNSNRINTVYPGGGSNNPRYRPTGFFY
jgi:hypothetical protein